MYQGISKFFVVILVLAGLQACAATNQLEKQLQGNDGKLLNGEQARNYLSGNTQQWSNGGAYFKPDGAVSVKFAGKVYPERIWTVDDDGTVCIAFRDGFKTSCSRYYDYNGEIWVVTLEVFGEAQSPERPFRYRRDGSIEAPDGGSVFGGPDKVLSGNRLDAI